jgi:hypothetical protein
LNCDRNELKYSFFDVVNIEEKLHFAWRMAELRDIGFEVFLDLRSEIAEAQAHRPTAGWKRLCFFPGHAREAWCRPGWMFRTRRLSTPYRALLVALGIDSC